MSIKRFFRRQTHIILMLCFSLAATFLLTSSVLADSSTISLNSSIANQSTVEYKQEITLSGTISPSHQTTVTIKSRRRGRSTYSKLKNVSTDANGNYSVTFKAGASGSYMATWAGDADHTEANSDSIFIWARSSLKITKVRKPTWAGQEYLTKGEISPPHKKTRVSLQIYLNKKWKTIARGNTYSNGKKFSIKANVNKLGRYKLRAAFSDIDHALTGSNRYVIRIKKANPWNISAAYAHYIVVSKRTFKLWYLRKGRIVKTFRAGVGQRRHPTPSGNYTIVRKAIKPTWYRPNADWAKNEPKSIAWPSTPLGARGLYLDRQQIIIHGTTKPWLLDRPYRAISHGCIRLKNEWVIWLYNRVPTGTHVKIYG